MVTEDIPVEEEVAGPKTATTPKTYTPKPRSKQTQPQVEVGLVTLVYTVMQLTITVDLFRSMSRQRRKSRNLSKLLPYRNKSRHLSN